MTTRQTTVKLEKATNGLIVTQPGGKRMIATNLDDVMWWMKNEVLNNNNATGVFYMWLGVGENPPVNGTYEREEDDHE